MPLDANDLQQITTIVERVTTPLRNDLDRLMPRAEYEKLHVELQQRVQKNEQNLADLVKWEMTEHDKLDIKREARFDVLDAKINEVNKQIDEVKALIATSQLTEAQRRQAEQTTTLRYVIGVIVSFAFGIAIPVALYFILRGH